MEALITNSIMDVMLNADTVLAQLNEISTTYGVDLSDALTKPWEDASAQAIAWKNELQESMTAGEYAALIGEGGAITAFANGVATQLEGSWSSAQTAAQGYVDFLTKEELGTQFENTITGFGTQIQSLVTYWDNVKAAAEAAHAEQERKVTVGGNPNVGDGGNDGGDGDGGDPTDSGGGSMGNANVKNLQSLLNEVFGEKLSVDGDYGPATTAAVKRMQTTIGVASDGKYGETTSRTLESYLKKMAKIAQNNDHPEAAAIYAKYHRATPSAVYAKGTMGTTKDQWALTDEIGDELVLVPGPNGNLSFVRKGTGIVPADMTQKLWELAQIPTSDLMRKNITAIVPDITKNDIKNEFNFDSLVHVDYCDQNTLKDLEKMVDNKINQFSKQMNYSLKKFAR